MFLEQSGESKRYVMLEGTVETFGGATVRRNVGKEFNSYTWDVLVEFDENPQRVLRRTITCTYRVNFKDDNKKGSEKLISSLKKRERIICYGNASPATTMKTGINDKRVPLRVNVASFVLPDRLNSLLANLTDYEETAVDYESDPTLAFEQKRERRASEQKRKIYAKTKTAKPKKDGKEKKYAFD